MKLFRIPLVIILVAVGGRAFNAGAQTETNLHSFVGNSTDGDNPLAGLVQGSDGNFYGTTQFGGAYHQGTVFRISPNGNETNLYSFIGSGNGDGALPEAGLVQGCDGNFYGTTYEGGTNSFPGVGTVFRISPSGSYTSLYSFVGYPNDGSNPEGNLVQGSDGNFYGTTSGGGTNSSGSVFQITPGGSYTNLYFFNSYPNDGQIPQAGLVQGSDGNFYGTTAQGGTMGLGTVFRISPGGSYTNLYSFGSLPNDGGDPNALVQGSDGNFYGTTAQGGTEFAGTVFRITPSGSEVTLHSFVGYPSDGFSPLAGLIQGSDGNFYGTTEFGGTEFAGTVFRISPNGTYTNLYFFVISPSDGSSPLAGLVQGSDGSFYGTTYLGGTSNSGTVFKISVPLNPPPYPINQIISAHLATTNIIFAIPSIAGENYQLQFSSSMNPTNWVNVPDVSVTNSIGALLTLTNFGAASAHGFYRFDITP
jgi:uncharacterized repeat protein (TIGR03803 family)